MYPDIENESPPYIVFENVSKRYKMGEVTIVAVDNVCFEIEKGEFTVITGASGAGKTTVLNILGGIDSCDSGRITVDKKEVSSLSESELVRYRRTDVGFVFQFYNLIQNLTAKENVELAAQISGSGADVEWILARVGLRERMDNFPSQLSGGEQQRVAIARALAKSPKLLLCDEPTGALDYSTGKMILSLLQQTAKKENMTVVLITHNAGIAPMADRVIRLKSGTVEYVRTNPAPVSVEYLEW
ncbi:MAG: ABC transporter ATP-binding protein [Clostridiales bacterium]|jgi:putative ABC transport system ATP-binding protein|nr:ABC transporter ATP-binding protein [Clostridiales bacterium]